MPSWELPAKRNYCILNPSRTLRRCHPRYGGIRHFFINHLRILETLSSAIVIPRLSDYTGILTKDAPLSTTRPCGAGKAIDRRSLRYFAGVTHKIIMAEKNSGNINRLANDFYQKALAAAERKNLDYAIEMFIQTLNIEPNFTKDGSICGPSR